MKFLYKPNLYLSKNKMTVVLNWVTAVRLFAVEVEHLFGFGKVPVLGGTTSLKLSFYNNAQVYMK